MWVHITPSFSCVTNFLTPLHCSCRPGALASTYVRVGRCFGCFRSLECRQGAVRKGADPARALIRKIASLPKRGAGGGRARCPSPIQCTYTSRYVCQTIQ